MGDLLGSPRVAFYFWKKSFELSVLGRERRRDWQRTGKSSRCADFPENHLERNKFSFKA
ncbi:hypothetical protein AXF42_Ash019546 [Apostasia shenzhenica]|uniref:Uncharacterized protein n=1 Tax=Apostasia shenzhenica TaxID=1088818 RepID=A0A2I0A0E6_9ASPA|nr:hypothetical protein AXF42_Ash019546 [Apostasia shenzhenica]